MWFTPTEKQWKSQHPFLRFLEKYKIWDDITKFSKEKAEITWKRGWIAKAFQLQNHIYSFMQLRQHLSRKIVKPLECENQTKPFYMLGKLLSAKMMSASCLEFIQFSQNSKKILSKWQTAWNRTRCYINILVWSGYMLFAKVHIT